MVALIAVLLLVNGPLHEPLPTLSITAAPRVTSNGLWTPNEQSFDGVAMDLVPPGCFMMGLPASDIATMDALTTNMEVQHNFKWFALAGPQSQVCLRSFWIDKYLVTNQQFAQFNGQAESRSTGTGPNHPRETISWFEARDFCILRGARLPTEAEWEYAARGPDDLAYPWGNSYIFANAVSMMNSGGQTADVVDRNGQPMRPHGASWVGAFDMVGNVREWTNTIFDQQQFPYPYSATDGRESNDDTIRARVTRGGGMGYDSVALYSAFRNYDYPAFDNNVTGFRCARS